MLPTMLTKDAAAQARSLEPHIAKVLHAAPFLGQPTIARWSEEPLVFADKAGLWLLAPADRDPLRLAKGGLPIPAGPFRDLCRIAATGVHFDRIAIAHEVPATPEARALAKDIPASGIACTDEVASRLLGDAPAPAGTRQLATRLDRLAALAARIVGNVGGASAGLLAGAAIDPIVFGVIGHSGGPNPGDPAAYFALTAWAW